ncbi:hypothetical protein GCM10007103_11080 [Salinimicrobium marinum]|uniref:Uncharacterized protein n=1 Tax=Salinimicrobium marinum TaxID=680283 RepID=A0A918SAL5_9FLAO|nr:hypothetical protein [Salinimicrobium marinum]GHA31297.1 hypothetical protein GCM10007103_11080 [Salinimicrobium marinum]
MNIQKKKLLIKSVVYDAIGMASMSIPLVGPFLDLAWAPYAAKKMSEMYPGRKGKLASVIVFLEEILPFTDVIPTFTLMWLYTFVWKKEESYIEVEAL